MNCPGKRFWWRLRLDMSVVLLLLALLPVLVAAGPVAEPPSFDAFLQLLSGPLVAAAAGLALSVGVEYWRAYDNLEARWKRLIFFGLCLIIPVMAAVLRGALGYVPWSFDPLIWSAIWNGCAAGGIGTLAHTRKLGDVQ